MALASLVPFFVCLERADAQTTGEVGCFVDAAGLCSEREIQCESSLDNNNTRYGVAIGRLCDEVNELGQVTMERDQCLSACNGLVVQYNQNVYQYNESLKRTQDLLKRYEVLMAKAQRLRRLCSRKSCKKVEL